jgi:hypothetical protein
MRTLYDSVMQAFLQKLNSQLSVVQLALELTANIYSEDVTEKRDDMWDDEMDGEFEPENEDMMDIKDDYIAKLNGNLAIFLFEGEVNLFSRVLNICVLPDLSLSLHASRPIQHRIEQVKCRAFSCVSNFFLLGLANDWIKTHSELVERFVVSIFQYAVQIQRMDPIPIELLEGSISCIWAILHSLQSMETRIVFSYLI